MSPHPHGPCSLTIHPPQFFRLVRPLTRRDLRLAGCMKVAPSRGRCRLRFHDLEANMRLNLMNTHFPLASNNVNDAYRRAGLWTTTGEEPALPQCDVDQPNRTGGQPYSGKAACMGAMWLTGQTVGRNVSLHTTNASRPFISSSQCESHRPCSASGISSGGLCNLHHKCHRNCDRRLRERTLPDIGK
jgi:hypothetical protein